MPRLIQNRRPAAIRTRLEVLEARDVPAIIGLETSDILLNANTQTGAGGLARIAMKPDGTGFVAVWVNQDGGGGPGTDYGVYARIYNANWQPLGNEFLVNSTTAGQQTEPAVAIDPSSGNFTVVWTSRSQAGGSGRDIVMRRFSAFGTALTSEEFVNNTIASDQSLPSIAMNATGNFVISWASGPFLSEDVYARQYLSNGMAANFEFRVNATTTGEQSTNDVACDAAGNFVVAWNSFAQDGDQYGVYASRYTSFGAQTSAETHISSTTTGSQQRPRVALDSSGTATFVWTSPNVAGGSSSDVVQRRFNGPTLAALTGEMLVNTTVADAQLDADIDTTAAGNYVVTWTSNLQDGDQGGIYARLYNSSGAATTGELPVNIATTGNEFSSGVGIDTAGDYVVGFGGPPGAGEDLYLRRFAEAPVAQFSASTYSLTEATANAPVVVSRTGAAYALANLATSVSVSRTGGSASAGSDYTNVFPASLTIATGSTSATLNVPILSDTAAEVDETIAMSVALAGTSTNQTLGSPATSTLTIVDNDPATVAVNAGNNQSTTISTAFASALSAIVKNTSGGVLSGINVTFTAPASGASAVFSNSTNTITVATNASGIASSGTFSANGTGGGNYSVSAKASGGSSPSASFTLTNNAAPSVTTNPTDQSVNAGQTASFTAAASGFPVPTVQWRVSVSNGPFDDIIGATSTTYTTPATIPSNNGNRYQAVFTNGIGSPASSTIALLTVNTISGLTVDGGAPQRSRLTSIQVTFSTTVNAASLTGLGAITLTRTSGGPATVVQTGATGANGRINVTPATGTVSSVTLTFDNADGSGATAGVEYLSLADGRWRLAIPSLSYQSALNDVQLRRLFGDINNDGTVDGTDLGAFGSAFGSSGASAFDFNNDLTVDALDFGEFGARFGLTL